MPVLRDDARVGVVYTPPEVAGPMVELALDPLVRDRSSKELLALRVCDPAIGEGAFLVEVVRVLAERVAAAWQREGRVRSLDDARRDVVAACIAGVDALELDWARAYPQVFARGGFDAIVGNPPYVRQERLGAAKPGLRSFASYDGVADLYVYFVELAHRIARRGGRYCLITPNKWLIAAYGRGLRAYLAAQGSVEGIVDLARSALFEDADAFPSIVWGTIGEPTRAPIRATRLEPNANVAAALRGRGVAHERVRWTAEPWHIDTPADRALIDRLDESCPPLGEQLVGRPMRGVVTGCNRAFEIDRATRDALLGAEPKAASILRPLIKGRDVRAWTPDALERWILLVDRGTSLDELPAVAAHLAQFREALEPKPAGHSGRWKGRKPGSYRWYELQDPVGALAASRTQRLFYQDIQTQPACCIDLAGELVPDTTVWVLPTADRYLLAVLNSPLYRWYAKRRFPPALNGAVRPKLEYMRAFPIATPSATARTAIEKLVEQRLAVEDKRRRGDPRSLRRARELDRAIETAVLDSYALSTDDRARIAAG
jgi:hypothetical protein